MYFQTKYLTTSILHSVKYFIMAHAYMHNICTGSSSSQIFKKTYIRLLAESDIYPGSAEVSSVSTSSSFSFTCNQHDDHHCALYANNWIRKCIKALHFSHIYPQSAFNVLKLLTKCWACYEASKKSHSSKLQRFLWRPSLTYKRWQLTMHWYLRSPVVMALQN